MPRRSRPKVPDFTQPRKDWRAIIVDGETLYVPRGLSLRPDGSWRSTYLEDQRYFPTLEEAWIDLDSRKKNPPKWQPVDTGPKKRLDTGVIGVNIAIYGRKSNTYVAICVSQSIKTGYRSPAIGHIVASDLTQQWLDQRLCEATAVRWHYVKMRLKEKPDRAVKLKDIPQETIPRKPMKFVDVDDVFAAVDQRMEGDRSQGRRKAALKVAD